MGTNFVAGVFTARTLGPALYGDLKFVQAIWLFFSVITTLGYLQSGSRLLLLEKNEYSSKEIIGTILLVVLIIGFLMTAISFALAETIDSIFQTEVSNMLTLLAPLIMSLTLRDALALILQSKNLVPLLAILYVLPPFLYLVSLLIILQFFNPAPLIVLLAQQLTTLIVILFIFLRLKPRFVSVKKWLGRIRGMNKAYGWPVYTGSMANVASGHLTRISLSYWVDNTAVGFFSLALTLVEPLKMVPNAVATSSFRDFASQKHVPKKILRGTLAVTLLALLIGLVLLGRPLSWIYTEEFASVSPIARVATIGALLHGFGDLFNRFLGAHGKGDKLRNTAFLVGIVNVVGFLVIVPLGGLWGAILVTVSAGGTYFLFMLINYRQHVQHLENSQLLQGSFPET